MSAPISAPQPPPPPSGEAPELGRIGPGGGHAAAGWFPDPWGSTTGSDQWRWWDGHTWTAHTRDAAGREPRLPSWLSVPVLVALVFTVPTLGYLLFANPMSVVLGLVPIAIVWPVLAWLDRVEPEPLAARIHAVLWGATVAGFIAVVINTIVDVAAGSTVAAVVSAPIVEELGKAAGILWMVRRHEVDSVMDGLVYAGWVGLGFAVIEDMTYFALAPDGALVGTFVMRALLTPFAHPLFTAWTGLAIGRAIEAGRPPTSGLWWGLPLAIGSHAAWNGSLSLADATGEGAIIGVAALAFVVLFFAAAIAVARERRREERRLVSLAPTLAARYGLHPAEWEIFGHWDTMIRARKQLPRSARQSFDDMHAAMARLAALHDRPGGVDPVEEQRLWAQLHRARQGAAAAD